MKVEALTEFCGGTVAHRVSMNTITIATAVLSQTDEIMRSIAARSVMATMVGISIAATALAPLKQETNTSAGQNPDETIQ